MYVLIFEQFGVGGSGDEPQQLLHHSPPEHFLVSQQRESAAQIVPHHSSEYGLGARACPIHFGVPILAYVLDHAQILIFFMFGLVKQILSCALVSIVIVVLSVIVGQVLILFGFGNETAGELVLGHEHIRSYLFPNQGLINESALV